ncbi:MAG: hypothetical protein ACI8Z9_000666 [Paraglaciecola sp.]|jgi:hypothetical protein
MQDNQDYILGICHTLSMQGKQPSVALIRSQATRSLLIPQVIKGLQAWKKNPQLINVLKKSPEHDKPLTQLSLEQRIEGLEQQVVQMSKQIAALLKLT